MASQGYAAGACWRLLHKSTNIPLCQQMPCISYTVTPLLCAVQVRVAGLSGLVALCQLLPREAKAAHMLPLLRRHMQPLELALPLQRALASAFPELLAAVGAPITPAFSA